MREACPFYRFGVTTFEGETHSSDSLQPRVKHKEWCEHPMSKHGRLTDNLPCDGNIEKCDISPEELLPA